MMTTSGPRPQLLTDDEWDRAADAELDALAASMPLPGPPVRRTPTIPEPRKRPPVERDPCAAVLDPDGVGEFLRSCRAAAGVSQRGLAEAAGVPQSTVARIESGRSGDVRLATVARLAAACGVALVGALGEVRPDATTRLVQSDRAQRHRDALGRFLPAHLANERVEAWHGAWWGDDRYTHHRVRPRRSYGRGWLLKNVPLPGPDTASPAAD